MSASCCATRWSNRLGEQPVEDIKADFERRVTAGEFIGVTPTARRGQPIGDHSGDARSRA